MVHLTKNSHQQKTSGNQSPATTENREEQRAAHYRLRFLSRLSGDAGGAIIKLKDGTIVTLSKEIPSTEIGFTGFTLRTSKGLDVKIEKDGSFDGFSLYNPESLSAANALFREVTLGKKLKELDLSDFKALKDLFSNKPGTTLRIPISSLDQHGGGTGALIKIRGTDSIYFRFYSAAPGYRHVTDLEFILHKNGSISNAKYTPSTHDRTLDALATCSKKPGLNKISLLLKSVDGAVQRGDVQ